MNGYDAWLERPYQQMYAEEDAYNDFLDQCHMNGVDAGPDDWQHYKETGEYPELEPDDLGDIEEPDAHLEAQFEQQHADILEDDFPF